MGCTVSTSTEPMHRNSPSGAKNPSKSKQSVEEYVRLDMEIAELEETCPGPRLATAEAWIERLEEKRDALLSTAEAIQTKFGQEGFIVEPSLGITQKFTENSLESELSKLALSLGIILNPQKASLQEEFFIKLSKSALHITSMQFYDDIVDHSKSRAAFLSKRYRTLNDLYIRQDGFIALISGGTYMTSLEENLDSQLETARDVRDKIGCTLEQWRICGLLLQTSAKSASQALMRWKELKVLRSPRDIVFTALDSRKMIQASVVSLECAQLSLPNVQIEFISQRQILAVSHVNIYMLTDIADESRYSHATKVLESFEGNLQKASSWLYETCNKTLRQEFNKAENRVKLLAQSLRNHRYELFKKEVSKK